MYHYVGAEVAGGLGEGTEWAKDAAGRDVIVEPLRYEFAGWLGDDLVTTSGFWVVTGRLADALRASSLTGFELAEVVVTQDEQWGSVPQRGDFPDRWERLVPTGTEDGGQNVAVQGGTDLLLDDEALALFRQFSLANAEVGDDAEPIRVDLDRLRAIAAERRAERDAAEAAAVEAAPAVEAVDVSHLEPIDGVSGEVLLAINALGATPDDPRVADVLRLATGPIDVKTTQDPRRTTETHAARQGGFDVRFFDGVLSQVTFHFDRKPPYPRPTAIIEGLDVPHASREAVIDVLGEPYETLPPIADRFKVGSGHVHFGWTKTGERTIVVLLKP